MPTPICKHAPQGKSVQGVPTKLATSSLAPTFFPRHISLGTWRQLFFGLPVWHRARPLSNHSSKPQVKESSPKADLLMPALYGITTALSININCLRLWALPELPPHPTAAPFSVVQAHGICLRPCAVRALPHLQAVTPADFPA